MASVAPLIAADAAATSIASIIGAVAGGIPFVAAWWRSTRTARRQADDASWNRAQQTIRDQETALTNERLRAQVCEAALRACAAQYDELLWRAQQAGTVIPPHLAGKPWETRPEPGSTKG
jgi:hypothetical protein